MKTFFFTGNFILHCIKEDKADTLLMVHLKWAINILQVICLNIKGLRIHFEM